MQPRPSEVELQVLSVLWERAPLSVREVLDSMPDGKSRSYTTILSVLQVMEQKGLVTHESRGRAHVFRATVKRKEVLGPLLRNMVSRVFGGSTRDAVLHLIEENDVDRSELDAIRSLLDEQEGEGEADV